MTHDALTQSIIVAGDRLAEATERELRLEDERHTQKMNAMLRLLGTENPTTGKAYSATAANDFASTDTEYQAYLGLLRNATVEKLKARAYYEATVIRARLAASEGVAA